MNPWREHPVNYCIEISVGDVPSNHLLATPTRIRGNTCKRAESFVLNRLATSSTFSICSIAFSVELPEKVRAYNESGRFKYLKSAKKSCLQSVVMHIANMKFQLSHAVIGDDATEERHRRDCLRDILAILIGCVPFLKGLIFTPYAPLYFCTDSCLILGRLVFVPPAQQGIVMVTDHLGLLPPDDKMIFISRVSCVTWKDVLVVIDGLCIPHRASGIIVLLVLFAGLMSGLTLGLMSMSLVDLEVLAKSGTPNDRKYADSAAATVGTNEAND
nr:DUF21 domain-containing protein At2g14520-like [Tanacetum cinerariifolium]